MLLDIYISMIYFCSFCLFVFEREFMALSEIQRFIITKLNLKMFICHSRTLTLFLKCKIKGHYKYICIEHILCMWHSLSHCGEM